MASNIDTLVMMLVALMITTPTVLFATKWLINRGDRRGSMYRNFKPPPALRPSTPPPTTPNTPTAPKPKRAPPYPPDEDV